MSKRIVIGTRASELAIVQATACQALLKAHFPTINSTIAHIQTTGDIDKTSSLSDIGGKGVFIKELERALQNNTIDIAVHSFKDITSESPDELVLAGSLVPESVADVVVLTSGLTWEERPRGAIIATGSLRRKAQLLALDPSLQIVDIRGNVPTRLNRLETDAIDGVVLSEAGLIRLGLSDRISHRFDPNTFIPAPGQGVITMQTRANDTNTQRLVQQIADPTQSRISNIDYALLKGLAFNCRLPLGSRVISTANGHVLKIFLADETLRRSMIITTPINDMDCDLSAIISKCKRFLDGKIDG